jgi:hypothetical protein
LASITGSAALVSPVPDLRGRRWLLGDLENLLAGVDRQAITTAAHLSRVAATWRVTLIIAAREGRAHTQLVVTKALRLS